MGEILNTLFFAFGIAAVLFLTACVQEPSTTGLAVSTTTPPPPPGEEKCPDPTSSATVCVGEVLCSCSTSVPGNVYYVYPEDDGSCPPDISCPGAQKVTATGGNNPGAITNICSIALSLANRQHLLCSTSTGCHDNGEIVSSAQQNKCCTKTRQLVCVPDSSD